MMNNLSNTAKDVAAKRRSIELYGRGYSHHYRQTDDGESKTTYFLNLSDHLKSHSLSFGKQIDVLDLGYGTGRYFNALQNVNLLYRIDISEHMLAEASNPVLGTITSAKEIVLIHGGVAKLDEFPERSVDLVYAIGILGAHCLLDVDLCNAAHRILRDGGLIYFSIADADNRTLKPKTRKRRVMEGVYALLPPKAKKSLDERWLDLSLSKYEIHRIVDSSLFAGGLIETALLLPESWLGGIGIARYESSNDHGSYRALSLPSLGIKLF